MMPDARVSDVRAMIVKALDDPELEVSTPANREPRTAAAVVPEVLAAVERITQEMWGNIPVIQIMQGRDRCHSLAQRGDSSLRRFG